MPQEDFGHKKLNLLIEERGRRILEKFDQVATSDVHDSKLLAALAEVKNYWSSPKSRWSDLVRPALTSFCCEAVGGEPKAADEAGLMFTLASSGFGIHDDLLDKSQIKHLRWTILGRHGSDISLLVGDLLIVKGWTMVHKMIGKHNPKKIERIIKEYGKFSIEVCEAELLETLCRRKPETDLDYYLKVIWKEMAETEACSKIGAIIGDGGTNEVKALAEFGRRLGFMSRLADEIKDCLNIEGDLAHRIMHESLPLPLLYAAKSSKKGSLEIKKIIDKSSINPLDVKRLLEFCFETEAFEYVRKIAFKNKKKAARNLRTLKSSEARNALSLMNEESYARITKLCI